MSFSVDARESFDNIKTWMANVNDNGKLNRLSILVGNKTDLDAERQVPLAEA